MCFRLCHEINGKDNKIMEFRVKEPDNITKLNLRKILCEDVYWTLILDKARVTLLGDVYLT
jgi:hypothetical protein